MLKPFLERFEGLATAPAPGYAFQKVTIGKGGETPELPYPDAQPPERPKDFTYNGRAMEAMYDSKEQYWVKRTQNDRAGEIAKS